MRAAPEWFPHWPGETCIIVASGPSAAEIPVEDAKGLARFIAVNNSWKLCPWADVLYACDVSWWRHAEGVPDFHGLRMSIDPIAAREFNVRLVECSKSDDRIVLDQLNKVGWGGNSGFHALNLAVQFGCSKIILVGLDMTVARGTHWHGNHPKGMNNPTANNSARWRRATDAAARHITDLGVQVINCSQVSALQNYPKMGFEEALAA